MENSDPSFSGGDFGFAFNNVKFSDRLLRIEITCAGSEVSCSSNVDLVKDRKRRRQDHSQNHPHGDLNKNWCDLNKSWCETNYENNNNNKHEETMVITERASQSGGEDESEFYNWGRINNASILRVKELHISSAILASKSPFFYKLFSNGMLESEQKHMSLKIDVSEEAAVMELLYFMYSNLLTVTTASALLDVLMAADKFEVASCMKYCSRLLLDMPMTLDSALLFLGLPPSLQTADSVKPLTCAARQFIASRYKDITKCLVEEVIALPLVGIEAILASDDLQIPSEDILYEVVLKWAKTHYSVLEERQEILGSHLARYIRFPHMTCHRLKKILASNDFRLSVASKLVLEALFFKAESLHHRRVLAPEQPASINHSFVGRSYKYRPIKIVEFEAPRHQCIVYLDLKRKECEALHPSDRIYSQTFHLGGQGFSLSAHHNMDQLNLCHSFGLFLGTEAKGTVSLTVDYNFSARSMPTKEFAEKIKGNYKFTAGKAVGCRNLFTKPWEMFIGKDCPYFINDVLHLRAELSICL